jgi:uncharacterized membrane protein
MVVRVSIKILTAVVLAALYAALVIALPSISYGPIQVRVADILSPLPYVMGFESVIGLTLGTLIANAFSPYGVWDTVIGTLCTFTYTLIDWALGKKVGYRKWMLPVVAVINSLVVGLYIGYILLGAVAGAGNPVELFVFLTAESLIPMGVGSLVVVPVVKRYLRYR